jgi:DNA repair exonuclease SbcCD nuclease subunit
MLRLLHMADVHLGARHEDLGEAAAALRERQHAALRAAVDLALAERVGAVLVAGDLFDSNTASRRTVEGAVAELARLAAAGIRVVLLPGDHDAYTRSSIYRAYDIPRLAGDGMVTLLTPEAPVVNLDKLDAVVVGPADPSRSASSPFADLEAAALPAKTWRIGMLHAAPGEGAGQIAEALLEASGLDFVALGHDHVASSGSAGDTTWAVPGSPEQVVVDRDTLGTVNLVSLEERGAARHVAVTTRVVGSAWHRDLEVDSSTIDSQAALLDRLRAAADPELVLDVRLAGERRDSLELDPAAVEDALRGAYLHVRVADVSRPPLTVGALPPPETVAGAFIRNVEERIAEFEASDAADADREAAELREVLRLGRRLLAGAEAAQ